MIPSPGSTRVWRFGAAFNIDLLNNRAFIQVFGHDGDILLGHHIPAQVTLSRDPPPAGSHLSSFAVVRSGA